MYTVVLWLLLGQIAPESQVEKVLITVETDKLEEVKKLGSIVTVNKVMEDKFPKPELKIKGAEDLIPKGELVVLELEGKIPEAVKQVKVEWVVLQYNQIDKRFRFKRTEQNDKRVLFGAGVENDELLALAFVSYQYVDADGVAQTVAQINTTVKIGDGIPTPIPVPVPVPIPTPTPIPTPVPTPVPIPTPIPTPVPVPVPIPDIYGLLGLSQKVKGELGAAAPVLARAMKESHDMLMEGKFGQPDSDLNDANIKQIFASVRANNQIALKAANIPLTSVEKPLNELVGRIYSMYMACQQDKSSPNCKVRKIMDIALICAEISNGLGI